MPFADFIGCEPDFPGPIAIPETVDQAALAGRGGEHDPQFGVLNRVPVGSAASEIEFESTPFGNQSQLFRAVGDGRAAASQEHNEEKETWDRAIQVAQGDAKKGLVHLWVGFLVLLQCRKKTGGVANRGEII